MERVPVYKYVLSGNSIVWLPMAFKEILNPLSRFSNTPDTDRRHKILDAKP
jgi:hypothetical protein